MRSDSRYYLKQLKRRYLLTRSAEILLLSAGVASGVVGVALLLNAGSVTIITIGGLSVLVVFFVRFYSLALHKVDESRLLTYINRQYPSFEQSADLLLKEPEKLSQLQQIQKIKTEKQFEQIYPSIKLPQQWRKSAAFLIGGVALAVLLSSFSSKTPFGPVLNGNSGGSTHKQSPTTLPAAIKELTIRIQPPAYTGKPSRSTTEPHLNILESSKVLWQIVFTDSVSNAALVFSRGDTVPLVARNKVYSFQRSFAESGFYQVSWSSKSGVVKTSDYYKIEITHDQSPEIAVQHLAQFTELAFDESLKVDLNTTITDDYGIQSAYIIATVSKGSGESVKFREEKLFFTTPAAIKGRSVKASRVIDLLKLGLEPGDELYFYIEALDNKSPKANRSRTETFFIALQDTASQNMSMEAGLGVDLMPEYFRSQRQIIIDSEKLLRERKSITKQEFNSRSNELGYDQKVLRLKYGEFLGEEFESAIGPGNELPIEDDHAHEGEEKEDPSKQYGHVHDKENEHNLVPDKKNQPAHKHNDGISLDPEKKEDPTEAYKHVHDDPEEATFFTQSIRSKLKAALTVMWDAELHLRMFDPEKSLPYQYTALKLLKEISNDSRIYVHKTGFDPPPLKEEKRLTGDLSEIRTTRHTTNSETPQRYPSIRKALAVVESKLQDTAISLAATDKQLLLRAGQELSILAVEQPGNYLDALSKIQALNGDALPESETRTNLFVIRKAFWRAIPGDQVFPSRQTRNMHPLDQTFIENLEDLKK